MRRQINNSTKKNSTFFTYQAGDCNLIDPNIYFSEKLVKPFYDINLSKFELQLRKASYSERIILIDRCKRMAEEDYRKRVSDAFSEKLPEELIQLLSESKKKVQQKLIKKIKFSTNTFISLPLFAWKTYRMPFSATIVDHLPKELNKKVFPNYLLKEEDGEFEYTGFTDLTKGEMESAISKRNRIISEFIGDETTWHCFFRTMAGIRGTEVPHEGQPHLHYISSAWGIKRSDVIEQLKSYRYKLNAETIPFVPC